jgi:TetR/AcrR family transcriptional repressor of nem operon
MARPKEFDVDAALERALDVFWRAGYSATSVDDLVAAMGIGRASLYATFGDKRELYLAALRHYQDVRLSQVAEEFARAPSARAAIEDWLAATLARVSGAERDRGCFCVNASTELASHDQAVGKLMAAHGARVEALLAATLVRARAEGSLPRAADPQRLASFLYGVVLGLNVLGKQHTPRARLEAVVAQALTIFVD